MSPSSHETGFALAEALVAAVLGLLVVGAALGWLVRQSTQAESHPDRADLQQRARAAGDILSRELGLAGAWEVLGGAVPAMACCVPVVQPRRLGAVSPDPPGTARSDAITVVRVRDLAVAARLAQPFAGDTAWLEPDRACGVDPACGIGVDDHLLLFEPGGGHDFFLAAPPVGSALALTPRQPSAPVAMYQPGAVVVPVETRTLYFDAPAHQLRMYDGYQSDVPVIDNVSALAFEYWGTRAAPARARLEDADSCWFDAAGNVRHGRGATGSSDPDVRIDPAEFQDGPWCGAGDNRFDADLLRIRRIRASIRLRAGDQARGRGSGFADSGRARSADRLVPDLEVSIDVAPRALSFD